MRVLVTGGGGFLATAVGRALVGAGHEVDDPPHRRLDVTDSAAVHDRLAGVDGVVHTAYRAVNAATVRDAALVNVDGAGALAGAAGRAGIRLVHVSSDVVFSGDGRWRTELDPPDPVEGFAYGEQKAAAEALVRSLAPSACVVRTSLLWDDHGGGSLAAMVLESATASSTTRHFVDEHRCPVHVDDVAAGILALLADDDPPPVLHLVGTQRADRFRIATALAPTLGIDPASLRSARAESNPGPRPRDLRLDCSLARQRYRWSPRSLPTVD
jgi:dTDP-4-dehydrorhamnose reductase